MGYRIMIVDDSPAMRAFIRRVIHLSGSKWRLTSRLPMAWRRWKSLRTEKVDAILTDINMPVMDGEEFLRHLSEDDKLRPIPVIVVSTDASDCRMERMKASGARGYLGKPFRPEELRAAIEEALGAGLCVIAGSIRLCGMP